MDCRFAGSPAEVVALPRSTCRQRRSYRGRYHPHNAWKAALGDLADYGDHT
jgi:hypothetical protein